MGIPIEQIKDPKLRAAIESELARTLIVPRDGDPHFIGDKQSGAGGVPQTRAGKVATAERSQETIKVVKGSNKTPHREGDPAARTNPVLNKTETHWLGVLICRGYDPIWKQAITLVLDPPFKSYRPDLAYIRGTYLTFVEVKGPHRFREKGIAKAALAAKTYPQFRFELVEWTKKGWKESVLSE